MVAVLHTHIGPISIVISVFYGRFSVRAPSSSLRRKPLKRSSAGGRFRKVAFFGGFCELLVVWQICWAF